MGVNTVMLALRFIFLKIWSNEPLPQMNWRTMAVPGYTCGALGALGNFCSLYVVDTLGQGIGLSLIQSSVIVSGLWGILFYKEMKGKAVLYWSLCCAICLVGVVL